MDILYGRNPVLEALRAGRPARKVVFAAGIKPDERIAEILQRASEAGIPVEEAARHRVDDMTHTEHHQGVAGYFHARPPLLLDELLSTARSPALLVVLDGIQDPQNVGAIARTSEACGADGLVLTRRNASAVTPAAAKASAGATEHLRVAVVTNLVRGIDALKGHGVWSVGLDAGAPMRYDHFDFTQPLAVVLGGEGEGLHRAVRDACDQLVSLPMLGRVASLNVAASAAALLYEVQRQRGFAVGQVG